MAYSTQKDYSSVKDFYYVRRRETQYHVTAQLEHVQSKFSSGCMIF